MILGSQRSRRFYPVFCPPPIEMADSVDVIAVPTPDASSADASSVDLMKTEDSVVHFGKPKEEFRVYGTGSAPREVLVTRHYTLMRTNQTVDFVRKMEDKVAHCSGCGARAWRGSGHTAGVNALCLSVLPVCAAVPVRQPRGDDDLGGI